MARFVSVLTGLLLWCAGCASTGPEMSKSFTTTGATPAAGLDQDAGLIITPDSLLAGKVVAYNANGRFVIVNFPIGTLPALEQRMGVYRQGLKVGVVKISGPQTDDNIVADVIEGEALPGDQVREK